VSADLLARVQATGLLTGPVLVLFSGGRDSTCLLDLAVRLAGPVRALHVNYGLREAADADEAHCREVCERLRVPLDVVRAQYEAGNVQAWAREVRYAEAARLAGGARIAAGHTATDQVETVLYRLAASPGRRALLGMAAESGALVRPLLGVTRDETAAHCEARGLPWREDESNPLSARGRIRGELIPLLRHLHPAAEANILATLEALREDAEALDAAVADVEPTLDALAALPPALARVALQRMAGAPSIAGHTAAILGMSRTGTAALDLPGGLRAVAEYGRLRIEPRGERPAPAPARLPVPGRTAYGDGEITCERGPGLPVADGTLAADALAPALEVRPWRAGDRMRPLGLGGSRSLQDLFTDRKVPRERRAALPVVVSDGEIAWVPGVATGERFRVTEATADRVRLVWSLHSAAR
jgi:tRNA(Ile)-lysidine synthase